MKTLRVFIPLLSLARPVHPPRRPKAPFKAKIDADFRFKAGIPRYHRRGVEFYRKTFILQVREFL
jgi:hypothetical protein